MNIFDIIIILFLIMSFLVGFKKGFIKETISLVGIILVFIISYCLKGYVGDVLCKYLPFFEISNDIANLKILNILLYQLIGFFIVYSILSLIYNIVLKASSIVQKLFDFTIIFILPSKILGGLVGLISGYVTLFAICLVLLIPLHNNNLFKTSNLVNKIVYETPIISKNTSNITSSINEIYDLGHKVSKDEISKNDANLKTLDIMLKHKIVSIDTVEDLKALDKLDDIENLDSVLNKYK